jgi:hypothetical protein
MVFGISNDATLLSILKAIAFVMVRAFATTLKRPFTVRYDPYTESVEILDDNDSVPQAILIASCVFLILDPFDQL